MTKLEIINSEREKYQLLHLENPKYGGRTGCARAFTKNNDVFHQAVKYALKTSKTLLDVGCGKGFFTDYFRNNYPNIEEIVGTDIADCIKEYRKDLNIVICGADDMPFSDRKFDFVAHMDGMEHIPVEIEYDVFREICRVSKRCVYMTIATHEAPRDKLRIKEGLSPVHINMKNAREWRDWIHISAKRNGFKVIGFEDYKLWVHVFLARA